MLWYYTSETPKMQKIDIDDFGQPMIFQFSGFIQRK